MSLCGKNEGKNGESPIYGKPAGRKVTVQVSELLRRKASGRWYILLGVFCMLAAVAVAVLQGQGQAEASVPGGAATQQDVVQPPEAYPSAEGQTAKAVSNGDWIILTSAAQGAEIYYTTDGSEPLKEDQYKYQNAITVSGEYGGNFVVRAFAAVEGAGRSVTKTFIYRIADKEVLSQVTATPGTEGKVVAGDKILLSCAVPGAKIFYTVDGSTPEVTAESDGTFKTGGSTRQYVPEQAVVIPEGKGFFCIYAVAAKADMANSPAAQFIYTYEDKTGVPFGSPSPGAVSENTEVLLQSAQKDAVIYYEIAYDGNEPAEPTANSPVFHAEAPVVISRETVIKAFAFSGRQASATVTLRYQPAPKMEPPSASVSSGSVVPSGTIVNLPVGNGTVYYTTDGSDPTDIENTAVKTGSSVILVGKPGDMVTVQACTREMGADASEPVTFQYQISEYPGGVTADKAAGELLAGGDTVYLTTDVAGGRIYYTVNGGNPLTEGTAGDSVVLEGEPGSDVTVKAVAVAPDTIMTGSYAFFDYKLMEQLKAPTASIKNGTILTEKAEIALKAEEGTVYFTIDGTEPTEDSHEYTLPIVVSQEMTIKAIAAAEGFVSSEVSSFTYEFAEKVRAVSALTPEGVVEPGENIHLSCGTAGAEIYYTTDGSVPDLKAEEGIFLYDSEEGIDIHRSVTIKAVAAKEGMCSSDVLTLDYTVEGVPIELARERAEAEKEEEGLKSLDTSKLASRRAEAVAGLSYREVTARDIINDIMVGSQAGTIPETATLSTKQISVSGEAVEEIEKKLGTGYEFLSNYALTLYDNGEKVQPNGRVEIGIPIPERHEDGDIILASVNENGGITLLETRRDEEYAYAEVNYLGICAVIGAKAYQQVAEGWNIIWILTVAAGVFVLFGMVLILRVFYRSRHRNWRK